MLEMFRLVLLGSFLSACAAGTCGLVDCSNHLDILFEGDTSWMEAAYAVTVVTPDGTAICAPSGSEGIGGVEADQVPRCSGAVESFAWPQGLRILGAPSTVDIRIEVEGELLSSDTFTPKYEEVYPNGKRCDKSPCHLGEVHMKNIP